MRTKPIDRDREFLQLSQAIDGLIANEGLEKVEHKGSHSWTYNDIVVFKLCFFRQGLYIFGIRKKLFEEKEKSKDFVRRAVDFSIEPQREIEFCGFDVRHSPKSIQEIQDFLNLLESH